MRKLLTAAMLAGGTTVAGCHAQSEINGSTVSKNYAVGNFQKIEVAGPYEVTVRTGARPGVSSSGSTKLLDRTVVEVSGDRLLIHTDQHRHWFSFGWGVHRRAAFTVTVPQLSGAEIAGSGTIHVGEIRGPAFEANVAGSGGIDIASADVEALKLGIAGSGGIKAAAGKAKSAEYRIGGSGEIDAASVATEQAKVTIAGSGSVKAKASGSADVDIMGSGDVTVTGGAKCIVSKQGSGSVNCS